MTRAELSEIAESFHALKAEAEAIEIDDKDTYARAALAWQQVMERLCMIDYALSVAFPATVRNKSETVH